MKNQFKQPVATPQFVVLPQAVQLQVLEAHADVLHYQRQIQKAAQSNMFLLGYRLKKAQAQLTLASAQFEALLKNLKVENVTIVVGTNQTKETKS